MTVDAEVLYIFWLPMDYEELLRFEKETDTSDMKRSEDTMAVRYKKRVVATYPYKSKDEPQTDVYDYKGNGKWEQTDCAWK